MDKLLKLSLCFLLAFVKCSEISDNEPTCFSWYDFAQKLLERTITAEFKVKQMESLLGDMETSWKQQQTEVNRLKSEIAGDRAEMKAEVSEAIDTAQDQVARMSRDLRDFQAKVNTSLQLQLEEQDLGGGGAVYVRWGRTVCPEKSTTVYAGIAAGSHYTHNGGPSTTICLPGEPIFGNHYSGGIASTSYIYGVEFEGSAPQTAAIFGRDVYNEDVPCVVCEATGRRSKMVVPARNVCYRGWHLEYSGYLMTSHHTQQRTNMECVDHNPEVVNGKSANDNGNLFYFVEAAGEIPDPPYTRGKELTCAICTK